MVNLPGEDAEGFGLCVITRENAHLVPPLLYRVFGYTYTDVSLYTSEGVTQAIEGGGMLFFAVVDARSGAARGLLALRFPFPSLKTGELGMLVVDPSLGPQLGAKVLKLLGEALNRKSRELAREGRLRSLISTEVTVHTLTQRLVRRFGFVTTGLYFGWTPAWAERLRAPPDDRLSQSAVLRGRQCRRTETVSALPFDKIIQPYVVAAPSRFRAMLSKLYAAMGLRVQATAGKPPEGRCTIREELDLRRSRVVLELERPGEDAASLLLERARHYRSGMIDLVHVAVPLCEVDVDPIVEPLLSAGFRYGALLPQYGKHDVLMLQQLGTFPLDLQTIRLAFPLARSLLRLSTESEVPANH